MAKRCEPARKMMRSNACLHADQARRQIGEPHTDLIARPFLAQHDRTTLILADNARITAAGTTSVTSPPNAATSFTMLELT